jgi:serine protease
MTFHTRSRRRGAVLAVASLAALAVTGIAQAGSASAAAGNPYSPAAGHSYRHGVLPTRGTQAKMNAYTKAHASVTAATGPQTLSYGGGVDGIGVQSGHSKVYFVFYGSQWGTSSTDANGNLAFTGDSAGAAGAAQQMFKGIGTNNELWSADLTQWCDGAGVATGATACPASGASYIPYQTGGVLSGVWYDNATASPSAATALQLGQEAVRAAGHFGNTTAASNRYAYYVILSPHGTNPDNYQGQYCAWHDYNKDVGATSSYGDIAFSNQPYNIDSGAGCGVGFVNSPGTLDGWTMTLGHEWHEMMSDQNPAGGWTNHTGSSYNGQENSDECAWLSPGTAGGAANVSFGSFGTYAEQASWSNDTNSCAISHPIVNHTVTPTNLIKNASGKCLEIENSSTSNGARAQQWDCLGQAGMYWRIVDVGSGYYHIVSNSSNKCLEIENSSYSNGARAQQWDCVGQSGALWTFSGANIINRSGKCLEIENSSYSNGARAQQWDCVGQSGAQWSVVSS